MPSFAGLGDARLKQLATFLDMAIASDGTPVLYVERPTYLVRSLVAYLVAFVAAGFVLSALDRVPLLGVLLAAAVFAVVSMSLRPLRHVTVYRDDSRDLTLLRVVQNERVAVLTR